MYLPNDTTKIRILLPCFPGQENQNEKIRGNIFMAKMLASLCALFLYLLDFQFLTLRDFSLNQPLKKELVSNERKSKQDLSAHKKFVQTSNKQFFKQ